MGSKGLKLRTFLAVSIALAASDALATGDLTCEIDDTSLAFTMFASTNREHGTIMSLSEASLTLKAAALAKIGREFKVEREHIIQQWLLQRELRIAVNIDNDNGSLLLTITGQGNATQERYTGRYVLKVSFPDSSTRTVTGRIKGCSAG